ncbi:hypothetical protein C6P46_004330 [Rhodotorula mucilaginosa]|uniref:DUF221-domain-containing protein n=1 Tax=Rhodotorula mucilaginosa TaxID=5537 RepID=A0A9P7BA70_RHOMI|nr:hypothetical protein C6P46_004330 [Rhodotorula mucilaginosa]TKA54993.1 hypothetical protein B0A53_02466 [Rhodotorula sp. CCFEE 5036]
MTTVADRTYSTTFSGLKSTAITAGAFIAGGVLLKEILQRMRRYPDEDRARKKEGRKDLPDRGVESWAMGYVYRARSYVLGPKTPDYSPTPLLWIWEAFLRKESYFETHAGADATVYIRFLRGTFFWMTFLLIIVFPILTGINYVYAASNFGFNSIDRASLTALVQGTRGLNLLPIHVTMVWLVTVSWLLTLFWIGRGVLRVRRNELRRLLRDDAERARLSPDSPVREDFSPELDPSIPPADLGWRYRTVLVRNIPVELRSEAALKQYFQERFSTATASEPPSEAATTYPPTPTDSKLPPRSSESSSVSETQTEMGSEGQLVAEIVLVRRQTELNELWFVKYAAVLHDLETAHVLLARNVMDWVRERVEREESARTGVVKQSPWEWFKTKGQRVVGRREQHDVEKDARAGDAVLFETLRPFLALPSTEDPLPETIWDALARLRQADPAILDRFQPQQRLRHFRSATVPAIDYHLTKHNLLFSLIEDQRARADEIEPASTAFVTFSRASDARRARADLGWTRLRRLRRGKVFELRAKMAPENRDLHWQRIVLVSLSSDILRQTLLNGIIWALTIIWVIPISLLIGLLSLQSLQERLPSLARWLETHEVARSLFTGLLPTAIISLLNMYTPTCIGIAKRKGLTLITESKWSAETQSAYWKFMVVNLLVIFCVGITAFSAILNAFNSPVSILQVVAAAFPKGATFFVSYVLLQVGVQCGIELSLLGISWINHASIRKYIAPRKRASEGVPRFFGYQSWVPNHLFMISIVLVFAILNPVVIAFAFLYFGISLIVFKQQFAHVYYRRNFESGGRQVFRRIFRYSLDIAVLSQVVSVGFFWTLKRFGYGGACIPLIPITVFCKLIGTRWFDHLLDELDEAKIDLICGENDPAVALSTPLDPLEEEGEHKTTWAGATRSLKTFALVTLPALVKRPAAQLPRVGKQVRLATHWHKGRPFRPKAVRHRSSHYRKQPASDNDHHPMLEQAGPGTLDQQETAESPQIDSSPEMQNVTTLGESDTAQQPTPAQVASATEFLADKAPTAEKRADEPGRLVTPHPPVLRDDRPVSHLRYRNPAFHAPLLRSLWLPRDPLRAVDLGDTVNLHVAFVSSAGGRGIIGSWEDIERSSGDSGHDIKTGQTDDSLATVTSSATHDVGGSLSPPSLRRRRSSQGHQNDDDGLEHAALPPPALVVDPSLPLGPGASAGAATSVPLPASPATPLATGPPPSLQLFSAEESHARASGSPSTAPLASPTRSTHSTTMSRILSGASSAYSATSPTRTRARTRTTRSGSLATLRSNKTSLRARRESSAPIPESGEVEEGDPISSTEAMRNELLAEERRSHLVHAQRDELRKQKEREEADARAGEGKGGLWRKVLLWHDEGILGDDT